MTGIIIAAAVVGITGIVIGILLGIAGDKFKVEVDQKEIDVRAELPGNNCGGCGFAGKGRHLLTLVLWVENLWLPRLRQLWELKSVNPRE